MEREEESFPVIKHSKKIMASVNAGSTAIELIQGVLSILLFFFYEQVLGLNSLLTGIGIMIYAIYDAFNDPIIGHLTDRVFKWTRRLGRRFPFIAFFFIPMLFSFLIVFSPPAIIHGNQFALFGWLIFSTCLFDTTESFFTVNFWALGPDKFRDQNERKTLAMFEVYLGFIGVFLSFLLPPMIVETTDAASYSVMAWICVMIGAICYGLMLPGVRDDKETVERFIESYEKREKESFFKILKGILSQKNYLVFLCLYILYQAMIQIMQASVFYHTTFILNAEEEIVTFILLMFFIGGLISVPLWVKYTKKTQDNRKTWILSATIMAVFSGVLTFMTNLVGDMIVIFLYGLGFGGFWVMITPVYCDVIDESVVRGGVRRESTYSGLRQFFLNLARVIQALTLALVHEFTGYVEGATTQSPLALFGIQLHFGLIPAIYIGIGVLIFWKFYDITPDKVRFNKKKLAELKL